MRWVLYSFHKQFATQEEEGGVCLKLLSITAINIEQWKAWTSILILRMLLTAKHDHVFAASMVVLSTVEDEEEADNNTDNMSFKLYNWSVLSHSLVLPWLPSSYNTRTLTCCTRRLFCQTRHTCFTDICNETLTKYTIKLSIQWMNSFNFYHLVNRP